MRFARVGVKVGVSSTRGGNVSASAPARTKRASVVRARPPGGDLALIAGVEAALEVLQGKWKVPLLFSIARGVHRPSRLLERLPGASKKMLTDTLRALERDGLVARRVFPDVPVRVEYSLTPLGWTTAEPLMALADWGAAEEARAAAARTSYGRTDSRAAAA